MEWKTGLPDTSGTYLYYGFTGGKEIKLSWFDRDRGSWCLAGTTEKLYPPTHWAVPPTPPVKSDGEAKIHRMAMNLGHAVSSLRIQKKEILDSPELAAREYLEGIALWAITDLIQFLGND